MVSVERLKWASVRSQGSSARYSTRQHVQYIIRRFGSTAYLLLHPPHLNCLLVMQEPMHSLEFRVALSSMRTARSSFLADTTPGR